MVARSTGQDDAPKPTKAEIRAFMRAMGSKGGKKGGKLRWEGVSPEKRSQITSNAAKARWGKQKATDNSGDREGI